MTPRPRATSPTRVVLLEACVEPPHALAMARAGADRIELCADLAAGGTTPPLAVVDAVAAALPATCGLQVMVRPRGGDHHTPSDVAAMCADAAALAAIAARYPHLTVGIVTGSLTPRGELDLIAIAAVADAGGGLGVTVHRAFDEIRDQASALDDLARLGIERVLTAGGHGPACDHLGTLAALIARQGPREPQILVAGGVRPGNVGALLAATGAREIHLRPLRHDRPEASVVTEMLRELGR